MKPRKFSPDSSNFLGPENHRFSRKLVFLLLILILTSQVLAIKTTLKQEYHPGETLIMEISGNFLDNINHEDILFYSGRIFIPLIYDIGKIENKFYLYALLPEKERNYTLIIKQARYYEAGEERTEDLKFDFSVSGNISEFSVNPGFIITDKEFKIKIEARENINLKSEFLNSTQEFSIGMDKTKTLSFSIADIKSSTTTKLILETENTKYEIPVSVFKEEIPETRQEKNLRFSKSSINFTVLKNSNFEFKISIFNLGEDIENITLNSDLPIEMKPERIEKLEAGEMREINITINSDEEGIKQGKITATSENSSAQMSITIETIEDIEEFKNLTNIEIYEEESCSKLQGTFCEANYTCEGTTKFTIDSINSLCCIGKCKKEEKNYGKMIALIIIFIFLIIIIFFVYRKLKLRKKSYKEVLKEKTESYEEKFKPREVKGSLER